MSDFIRQMVGQRRGPMGLGNNPAPFQIQQPGYSGMDALQQFMDSDERRRQEMMASPPRESDFPQGRMDEAGRAMGMGQSSQPSISDYYRKDKPRKPSPYQRRMPVGGPLPMSDMDDYMRQSQPQLKPGELQDYYRRDRMMSEPQMDMSPEALRDPNHPFYKRYPPAFW